MGHLMLSTMKKIQAALAKLTLDKDGVDGKGLYIYGEAWDFGEVRSPTHLLLETCFSGCDLLYCAKVLLSQSVSACLPACLSVYLSICLSVCLPACLPARMPLLLCQPICHCRRLFLPLVSLNQCLLSQLIQCVSGGRCPATKGG